MWKSLSRLTCLSGKKTAAPFRMALTASLCKAFSTNVSPSGPSTTETQILFYHNNIILHRLSQILSNKSWQAAAVQGISMRKLIICHSYCGRGECRVPRQPWQTQTQALHRWTWKDKPLLWLPRLALCFLPGPGAPVGWAAWGNSSASIGAAELCSSSPPLPHWDKDICFITGETFICRDVSHLLTNEPDHDDNYCCTNDCSVWIQNRQWECFYSHLPEFTVEVPEDVQAKTTEVQKILLLEVRGIL